jgi:iron-sulfur cluster repair protein YtfE (RIC family)
METLKSDHGVLAEILDQLKIQLAKPDLPWAFETLDLLWASLAVHIRAENICLFPAVLNAPRSKFGTSNIPDFEHVKAAVDSLRADHNHFMSELGTAMKEMRGLILHPENYSIPDVVADLKRRLNSLEALLEKHNEKEEELIYLWPPLLLDDETLRQLELGLVTEIENLPPRFARAS